MFCNFVRGILYVKIESMKTVIRWSKRLNRVASSPHANYTDRVTTSADEVVQTSSKWGCCMASARSPYSC